MYVYILAAVKKSVKYSLVVKQLKHNLDALSIHTYIHKNKFTYLNLNQNVKNFFFFPKAPQLNLRDASNF